MPGGIKNYRRTIAMLKSGLQQIFFPRIVAGKEIQKKLLLAFLRRYYP